MYFHALNTCCHDDFSYPGVINEVRLNVLYEYISSQLSGFVIVAFLEAVRRLAQDVRQDKRTFEGIT